MNNLPAKITDPHPEIYRTGTRVTLDFETTTLDYGSPLNPHNRLLLACWINPEGEDRHSFISSEIDAQELLEDIHRADYLVAQNAKFELGWLKRYGLDLRDVLVYDTMLAEWVIYGNLKVSKNLSALGNRYGVGGKESLVDKLIKNGVDCTDIPKRILLKYCQRDVEITDGIVDKQLDILEETNRLHILYARCLLTPAITDMEFNGLTIAPDKVHEEYAKLKAEQRDIQEALSTEFGDINWNSPQQVAEFLYDVLNFTPLRKGREIKTTAGGSLPTDKATISSLRATTEKQRRFVELYSAQSLNNARLTKSMEFFQAVCKDYGGTFYGEFNQGRTSTHRLSSSGRKVLIADKERGIQLQNIPREYKGMFNAKESGWLMVEADFSQLEFRAAVDLGNDPQGKEDIRNKADVHSFTASVLNEVPIEEVTKDQRQDAKRMCFPLYTEILTPDGFKRFDEVEVGDEVINYDPSSKQLVKDKIIGYIEPHEQEVIRMSHGHSWSADSTEDHRWYCEKRVDHAAKGRAMEPRVATTAELNSSYRIIVSAVFDSEGDTAPDEAALIAWLFTDGHVRIAPLTGITSQGTGGVRQKHDATLTQKKYVEELDDLLGRLGMGFTKRVNKDSDCHYWHLRSPEVRALFRRAGITGPESLPQFVLDLSSEARAAYLRAACLAEGHLRRTGTWRVSQNSGPVAESIKVAGFLSGHDVRVGRHTSYTGKINESITLRKSPYVGCHRIVKRSLGCMDVWCVTTNNHTVVIRQGDNIMISGQSFLPLFGGKGSNKAERKYADSFCAKYSGIYQEQERWVGEVLNNKFLTTPYGMRYMWPFCRMDTKGRISDKTNIFNYPIQGFATAEIVPIAITCLWHRTRGMEARLVSTVHDSAVLECPVNELKDLVNCIELSFLGDVYKYMKRGYNYDVTVPLACEVKAGTTWGDSKALLNQLEFTPLDKNKGRGD